MFYCRMSYDLVGNETEKCILMFIRSELIKVLLQIDQIKYYYIRIRKSILGGVRKIKENVFTNM